MRSRHQNWEEVAGGVYRCRLAVLDVTVDDHRRAWNGPHRLRHDTGGGGFGRRRCTGEAPVVFCGDMVEESADPSIDADSDLAAWPRTLDRILELGGRDALYVPGHGAVVDAAFVSRQRDWLRKLPPRSEHVIEHVDEEVG